MKYIISLVLLLSFTAFAKSDLVPENSVVKVRVTSQSFHFVYPWSKRSPYSKLGYATYIKGNRYITSAAVVQNASFIQLEKMKTGKKSIAKVECVDYLSNLAIVKVEDESFNKEMVALDLIDKLKTDDEVEAWQFEANGTAVKTKGEMRKAQMSIYTHYSLMAYSVNINLPKTTSAALPAVKGDKLAGLIMRYNSSTSTLTLIPPAVIKHFLKDFDDGKYEGFPHGGFTSSRIDDPELRDFVKLPKDKTGLYITYVRPGSSCALGGLKEHDVLLKIDDHKIDRNGQYEDADYGKMSVSHLITTRSFVGESRNFHIWRDGKEKTLKIKLKANNAEDHPSPQYIYDKGPDFIIVGGIIFTELSQQYLKEFGSEWRLKAPPRLVHYNRKQWELFKPGEKIVISSVSIPTPNNLGYEKFRFKHLDKVNGMKIKSLSDIVKAMASPVAKNGSFFQVFEFAKTPRKMVFNASELPKTNDFLKQRYRIPLLQRITK